MQGAMNQMVSPMQQDPMHPGSMPRSGAPLVGVFPSGLQNMQGPSSTGGPLMYQQGGAFNWAPTMRGYNHYQVGQGVPFLLYAPLLFMKSFLDLASENCVY